jgi:hypothetical protein
MIEEKETAPLTELSPREFAETLLSQERFQQVDSQISKIITPDFEDSLMRIPKKGERKNWQALVALTSIVFEKEIIIPKDEDNQNKPYKYKIEMDTTNEDGSHNTREMNARMVGQILQHLIAHAEATNKYRGKKSEESLEQDARETAIDHIYQAVKKHKHSQDKIENSDGVLGNRKKVQQSVGIVAFPGVDKASPEQVLHILKAIKQTSVRSTPAEKQRRDDLIRMGRRLGKKTINVISRSHKL